MYIKDKEVQLNSQTSNNLSYYLYHELRVFKEIFDNKDFNKCNQLLDYTHSVMKVYEKARKTADIVFPADNQ